MPDAGPIPLEALTPMQPARNIFLAPDSPATAARGPVRRFLLVALALGVLVGQAVYSWQSSYMGGVRPLTMTGRWIRAAGPPSYAGYFRRRLDLPGPVKHAWLAIAAREAFEVTVNGQTAGMQYLWKTTRPFQSGLSETGQVYNPSLSPMLFISPREYQWSGNRHDWLPVFVDITPLLKPGCNVICVEIESRACPALVRFDVEVELWSGQRLRFDSGAGWRAEPTPKARPPLDWFEANYPDLDWREAVQVAEADLAEPSVHYRCFDPSVLMTAFRGRWLRHPQARASDAIWFESEWSLDRLPDDAWIRIASNRPYDLFVNDRRMNIYDRRVVVSTLHGSEFLSGDWLLGYQTGIVSRTIPEMLDPGEENATDLLELTQTEGPANPTARDFVPQAKTGQRSPMQFSSPVRADLVAPWDMGRAKAAMPMLGRSLPTTLPEKAEGPSVVFQPILPAPKSLSRDRGAGAVDGFSIRYGLKAGRNTIRVRLAPPQVADGLDWPGQVAVDGEASWETGSRAMLSSGPGWSCRLQAPPGRDMPRAAAVAMGPAHTLDSPLPKTRYRGQAYHAASGAVDRFAWCGLMAAAAVAAAALALAVARAAFGVEDPGAFDAAVRGMIVVAAVPSVVIAAALLVEWSWMERYELLIFGRPSTWPAILAGAAVLAAFATLGLRRPGRGADGPARRLLTSIQGLPRTHSWKILIAALMIACGALRAYKIDFQPIDDDDYASISAISAIWRTGTPELAPHVYYTRSPLFHYPAALVVGIFGENLWSLRLPTVWFAIATALLVYRCGSRLLGRPWVGLGAMALFAVHPVAIYFGHITRFYQQQQFFSLLAVYWFCRGYVLGSSQRHRYLSLAAFTAAVLSQEITVVMGLEMALGALLFGRDNGWRPNVRMLVLGGCIVVMIVLDYLIFKSRCLTRLEGISPNVEAYITPHFWYPYNVTSLFWLALRLHAIPSLLLLLALPMLLKRKERVVWALLWFMTSGLIFSNLLISHFGIRFIYRFIPIWLLMVTLGIDALSAALARYTRGNGPTSSAGAWLPVLATLAAFLAIILSWSPWRITSSYEQKIAPDSTGALQYVRSQCREGDAIIIHEPHANAALLEIDRVDYALSIPVLHDFYMTKRGHFVDRNSNADAIGSLKQLRDALHRHPRTWIIINRERFPSRGSTVTWTSPAGRTELFLRRNAEVKYRSYLWTVFLWDAGRGTYAHFRDDGS